jgi:hypothetical protein
MKAVMESPLGAKAANDIIHEDIERWINGHADWSPVTRNRYKTTISRAYSLAMKSFKVTGNPARLVDHQDENNERVRWLNPEEEKRLKAAISRRCPDQLPALVTALHTGMRKVRAISAHVGHGGSFEANHHPRQYEKQDASRTDQLDGPCRTQVDRAVREQLVRVSGHPL